VNQAADQQLTIPQAMQLAEQRQASDNLQQAKTPLSKPSFLQ